MATFDTVFINGLLVDVSTLTGQPPPPPKPPTKTTETPKSSIVDKLDEISGKIDDIKKDDDTEDEQDKLYWYDSQPHPHDPTLANNHPHHKHVPPDIKHNRILAPELSFTKTNLPFLIQEVELLLKS